ncbi:UDP-N-acetylmuramate--L-alanine ligase, partial [Candidatus Dependentiae bacterium]|nr:UDP-N-acetylmuramate--L-alanine ligase [Candidatus Dependentiae bacterium]
VEALQKFQGVERRFTFRGIFQGAEVIDDYAHHPTEISATFLVALKKKPRNLIVVWQPHRYIRTRMLWDDFIQVFLHSPIDRLIITDVYGAGEQPLEGITGANLAKEISQKGPAFPVTHIPYNTNHEELAAYLETVTSEGDLVLLLGAGTINKVVEILKGIEKS